MRLGQLAVAPAQERALPAGQLAEQCTAHGLTARSLTSVADGLTAAIAEAAAGDLVVVTGSLFTVGEARAWLTGQRCEAVRG